MSTTHPVSLTDIREVQIIMLAEVYHALPKVALITILKARGVAETVELDWLPVTHLAALAINSHQSSLHRARTGPLTIDCPL